MPAIIDDPASPTIYRVSGEQPFPDPNKPVLPASITPRQVTLRDRQTVATVVPFISRDQVPNSLLLYLADQFAKEIIKGDTYPMMEPMSSEKFAAYWFQNFGAIMLLGHVEKPEDVVEGKDWSKECLGSFYIKPNYPGRSSHICNAGFLVTDASRNRGVGRLMGEAYINWAPRLGYSYSVFNLVYETNVASCRIWDALGFKRIGRVPRCGNLKSYPGRLVDAIIYGRDLSVSESEEGGNPADELVSQERFEKIKFYLKHARYPEGADRAEKSRLRSAATHYTFRSEDDVLMLNNKECIADPRMQYEMAREFHTSRQHGGINKTTAAIAEKYHWSRIKDTVSDVIKACTECNEAKDTARASPVVTAVKSPATNSDIIITENPGSDPNLTSSNALHMDVRRVNEDSMNVDSVVTGRTENPSLQSNCQGIARQGDISFQHNDGNNVVQSTIPSAGMDMVHNDPDLSAIYDYLAAPSSPQNSLVSTHHDYQPIDPLLMSHEQQPCMDQAATSANLDDMDRFFITQHAGINAVEDTSMELDNGQGLQTRNVSHSVYPDLDDHRFEFFDSDGAKRRPPKRW